MQQFHKFITWRLCVAQHVSGASPPSSGAYNCTRRLWFYRWRVAVGELLVVVSDHDQQNCVWNVKAHAQKPDFFFRRNGRVHLNRRGRQFSRLLAAELCASAVVMLDTPCSEIVWRVLATHSIRQFPRHFPSRASPCAITFQLDSTSSLNWNILLPTKERTGLK
jgi:hypothetical protein